MLYIVLPYKDRNGKYKCALENFLQPFIKYLDGFSNKYEIIIVEQLGGSISNTLPNYYESLVSSLQIKDDEFYYVQDAGQDLDFYISLKDKFTSETVEEIRTSKYKGKMFVFLDNALTDSDKINLSAFVRLKVI